jgi:homoserine dehydrogenase
MRKIEVGLLGLGNVGSGVMKLLSDNALAIRARLGIQIVVKRVLVREADKPRLVEVPRSLLCTDVNQILDDPHIAIVVELIGGEDTARDFTLAAFGKKKHVVTANKAMLAVHGEEIFDSAERQGVDIYYEASVAGGVPLLRALREGLASDRIDEVMGIVNGTSNFILSKMADETRPYADILAEAQAAGYAETDPTLDVEGGDAAHKLSILVSLCFGKMLSQSQIYREGITHIAPIDFRMAEQWGYVIKPLVLARADETSIEARVHPAMIPKSWMLAGVSGVYNAVVVSSYALGSSMYYGRGAGMMPTAVAVVSDIIEVARDVLSHSAGTLPMRLQRSFPRERAVRDPGDFECRFYLRFTAPDRFGVAAEITGALGEHGVPLAEVSQLGRGENGKPVHVIVRTFPARERNVMAALELLSRSTNATEPPRLLRIFE